MFTLNAVSSEKDFSPGLAGTVSPLNILYVAVPQELNSIAFCLLSSVILLAIKKKL